MERTSHRTSPWIGFLAGAVAMLALALAWAALRQGDEAAKAVRLVTQAAGAVPALERPRLPETPRIPNTPIPRPQ